jgi:hypothetical protein
MDTVKYTPSFTQIILRDLVKRFRHHGMVQRKSFLIKKKRNANETNIITLWFFSKNGIALWVSIVECKEKIIEKKNAILSYQCNNNKTNISWDNLLLCCCFSSSLNNVENVLNSVIIIYCMLINTRTN